MNLRRYARGPKDRDYDFVYTGLTTTDGTAERAPVQAADPETHQYSKRTGKPFFNRRVRRVACFDKDGRLTNDVGPTVFYVTKFSNGTCFERWDNGSFSQRWKFDVEVAKSTDRGFWNEFDRVLSYNVGLTLD